MPKITLPPLPISGLFGVAKPSGPTSMSIIEDIKQLVVQSKLFVPADKLVQGKNNTGKKGYKRGRGGGVVKIGQGGTLDPLADGVLVLGVGKGTKKLSDFLTCTKEYRTTCLLGCETDTYDGEGSRVRTAPWRHVTREEVESKLDAFRGEIEQAPPIFSALHMDGKRLYEYARQGIPLPRPIEKRKVTVEKLELTEWLGSEHGFRWPVKAFTDEERKALEIALSGGKGKEEGSVQGEGAKVEELEVEGQKIEEEQQEAMKDLVDESTIPTAFVLTMTVSGGTYVRSVVHDLAHAIGSAGHVVTLTRTRQGRFALDQKVVEDNQVKNLDAEEVSASASKAKADSPSTLEGERGCVPWEVFWRAIADPGEADVDGWTEWEREVIERLEVV